MSTDKQVKLTQSNKQTAYDWLDKHNIQYDRQNETVIVQGKEHKLRVRQPKFSSWNGFTGLVFKCTDQQKYYKQGDKILWVYYSQVGWNRDYFSDELALAEYNRLIKC